MKPPKEESSIEEDPPKLKLEVRHNFIQHSNNGKVSHTFTNPLNTLDKEEIH